MKKLLSLLVSLALLPAPFAAAAPQTTLSVRASARSVEFTITPSNPASGCTYNLFGALLRARLSRTPVGGRLLASAAGTDTALQLSASGLPRLKTAVGGRRLQLFFMVEILCAGGADRGLSDVQQLSRSTGRRGSAPRRWLRAVGAKLSATGVQQVSRTVEAFPELIFTQPVALENAGDSSNRLFVVEQAGTIRVFDGGAGSTAASTLFLDISSKVMAGGEQGLLGLAFHPNYTANRFFYVNYTAVPDGATVIARFTASTSDPNTADPASETEILRVTQPFANHNGGQLAFGPDGFLYIGLGDGGGAGDPLGNAQNRGVLLGKILRIDVDNPSAGRSYGIPADNPFAGNSQGFREEIYAYGFRNPWRFSFDTTGGGLWAGDVGQNRREEIDLVARGGNYGWPTLEGNECFQPPSGCDRTGLALPVVDYGRSEGITVTGGYVYRGAALPVLAGRYIYGDFGSGRIWSLPADNPSAAGRALLIDSGLTISSFGTDEQHELYIVDYDGGKIYRLT